MSVRSLYDELCEAVEDKGGSRRVILAIAGEVGIDIYTDVEGDDVWGHGNMLRVLRAVQSLRSQLATHRGLGGLGQSVRARQVPMAARGW